MKVTLIKVDTGYILLVDNIMHATDNDKLSKQNCDSLFGVVDVDKLANEESYKAFRQTVWINGFKEGFIKAMEFNKDKLFTMEQMNRAIHLACSEYSGNIIDEVTQQPTEIDVVIEHYDFELLGKPMGRRVFKPNLDSEGCLILKRK